jgi:simple sugar transport system permease protein
MNPRFLQKNIPFIATILVCVLLFSFAGARYPGFFTLRYLVSFVSEDAYLGIAAIGLTFVILSGGIDLSVGAVIGFVSILLALLIETHHVSPLAGVAVVLALGALLGAGMGSLIQFFGLPPFLVTLAGMFLMRGLGFVLKLESIEITHHVESFNTQFQMPLGSHAALPATTLIYLLVLLLALGLAHFTRFGRNVYAVGGSEPSAILMGLPVARTKVAVYTLGGFCSALAGVVHVLYTAKGDPTAGLGLELDAIAAVVIGGTLLSGGVGYVAGTPIGVLILGVIQAIINFQGTLNSWWTRIVIGGLLLVFILLQKLIQLKKFKTPA